MSIEDVGACRGGWGCGLDLGGRDRDTRDALELRGGLGCRLVVGAG